MTDRNRTLLAMVVGALIVVGLVAGFSVAEHGWGGDDDDESGASSDMTYCPALNAPIVSPSEASSQDAQNSLDLLLGIAIVGDDVFSPDAYFDDDDVWDDRVNTIADEAPSLVADDVEVVVEAARDGDGHRGDQVVLASAERVAGDAATRCGVGENLPYI